MNSSKQINFECPYCSRLMQLPAQLVGKQGKCPSCSKVVTVLDDAVANHVHTTSTNDVGKNNTTELSKFRKPDFLNTKHIVNTISILVLLSVYFLWPSTSKESNTSTENDNALAIEDLRLPTDFYYKLLREEISGPKRSVDVVITRPAEKDVLSILAKKIKANSETDFERTFIGIYLITDDTDGPYWATTHFTPDLAVRFVNRQTNIDSPADDQATAVNIPPKNNFVDGAEVELSFDIIKLTDGRIAINGVTNLPEGTNLFCDLRGGNGRIYQGSTAVTSLGTFLQNFGPETGIPNGNYVASVTCPYAFRQPEPIQQIIGVRGENLRGPGVEYNATYGNTVHAIDMMFSIP